MYYAYVVADYHGLFVYNTFYDGEWKLIDQVDKNKILFRTKEVFRKPAKARQWANQNKYDPYNDGWVIFNFNEGPDGTE